MRKILLLLASLTLLLILARAAGFHHIAETWRRIAPGAIALSVACYYASIVARMLAWKVLLGAASPSLVRLAPPLALGFVLGNVAPAKTGEPAVALLVSRAFGVPLPRTLSALAAERGVHLVVLLVAFISAATLRAGALLDVRAATLAAALVLAALLLAFLLARPLLPRFAAAVRRLPQVGAPLAASLSELHAILGNRPLVLRLTALAALFWALQFLSLWAILRGGGLSIDFPGAALVAGAAILGATLTFLPLGTQDGISAVVLKSFGVPLATGFALALFHTALSLACAAALVVLIPLWGTGQRNRGGGSPSG